MTTPAQELKPPQEWVAGFLLHEGGAVALIKKARPNWQKGKFNGVGGKVEPGETPLEAMHREWTEESEGLPAQDWKPFCILDWKGGRVHFFEAVSKLVYRFNEDAEEPISWQNIKRILDSENIIRNLRWLIPMALDKDPLIAFVSEEDAWNTRAPTPAATPTENNEKIRKALSDLIEVAKGYAPMFQGIPTPKQEKAWLAIGKAESCLLGLDAALSSTPTESGELVKALEVAEEHGGYLLDLANTLERSGQDVRKTVLCLLEWGGRLQKVSRQALEGKELTLPDYLASHRTTPQAEQPKGIMRVSGNVDESDPAMKQALDDIQAAAVRHLENKIKREQERLSHE